MAIRAGSVDVLMSIHPRQAEQILSGVKKLEFRRKSPRREIGSLIVYATAPVRRIVGFAKVQAIVEGSLDSLWSEFGTVAGITREEFDAYFKGSKRGPPSSWPMSVPSESLAPWATRPRPSPSRTSHRKLSTGSPDPDEAQRARGRKAVPLGARLEGFWRTPGYKRQSCGRLAPTERLPLCENHVASSLVNALDLVAGSHPGRRLNVALVVCPPGPLHFGGIR